MCPALLFFSVIQLPDIQLSGRTVLYNKYNNCNMTHLPWPTEPKAWERFHYSMDNFYLIMELGGGAAIQRRGSILEWNIFHIFHISSLVSRFYLLESFNYTPPCRFYKKMFKSEINSFWTRERSIIQFTDLLSHWLPLNWARHWHRNKVTNSNNYDCTRIVEVNIYCIFDEMAFLKFKGHL